ncbi:helix-turn-helix domain-containing protein [Halobacillus andaensis]|uniref:helix-turn-helix domain-containing protein n=1 Tax=Halobacillus andaensis TaxID=1176239 RepID=UPI003D71EF70
MRNGKILRQRRKELGMSQEELADSVVSPSYLSRIENDKTEADEETLKLLFQKVGVDYRKQTSNTKTIKRLLQEWEKPLLQNERKKSHQIYINLSPLVTDMVEIQLQLEYHIKSIRLFILKKELSKVKDCIVFLDDFYERLTSRNRFFYHKHVGNYEFYAGNFEKAESHFAKAALDFTEVHLGKTRARGFAPSICQCII